ncbi:MAG: glucosamine-6-phosphate deaminase [Planctomycetes bacterium DG_58]|nr:MAG: glucosamine-6-phosphate deaminase [Planctomycetes bacterium DG_58]KPL03204.1 MAG: glucosamine-6-phosphate deaminase [Planctomycetes bacterium SM23_65]
MEVIVKRNYEEMSKLAAQMIAEVVRDDPRAVLGLATGSTPLGTYKELIRMHKKEGLDFSQVVTFNLDEYVGLKPTHNQSYWYFMYHNLFKHINVRLENVHVPDGTADDVEAYCAWYDDEIERRGGIDIQILGIGGNGHIAFCEPGGAIFSRTKWVALDRRTIEDNSRFFRRKADVPRYAITMGIGTILEARQVVLLANKASKADAIAAAVEGPVTAMVPSSALQLHPNCTFIVDKEAAAKLKRKYRSSRPKLPKARKKK